MGIWQSKKMSVNVQKGGGKFEREGNAADRNPDTIDR